jgi:glycosyltransferase involved in cell wall biosynthesis
VRDSRPNFVDHYQPHLPRELGYYDSADPVAREAQVHLARGHGVDAFCYLCAWDARAMQLSPRADAIVLPDVEFPFCICWENGSVDPVAEGAPPAPPATRQGLDICAGLIEALTPLLAHERYLRVGGRPLLVVARPDLIDDAASVLRLWREQCESAGVGDPYLVCFGTAWGRDLPGFDAAVEFPPAGFYPESFLPRLQISNPRFHGEVRSYRSSLAQALATPRPGHKLFQTVMPAWDETAANADAPMIFTGSTPELFAQWTERALMRTRMRFAGEERLLFIRSWNEWNLGCHLEPDQRYGRQYLEAFRDTLAGTRGDLPQRPSWEALRATTAIRDRVVRSRRDASAAGPLVSVVMPAYNHERFVVQALDSVVAQSHPNLEIIVVDDGSTDTTGRLLDRYVESCETRRITVVHQPNAGAHAALNRGMAMAEGEFVALVNSDDLYATSRIERMLAAMRDRNAAFAFSDTLFIDENGAEIDDDDLYVSELRAAIHSGTRAPDPLYGFIGANIAISTGNFVFRRELAEKIGGFCAMQVCHDWDFVMAASYHTKLAFVAAPLYLYRLHRANTFSGGRLRGGLEIEQLQSRFFENIVSHPILEDPGRARRFIAYVRSRGMGGYLPSGFSYRARSLPR